MSKRFLITLITLLIIGVGASIAVLLAKGYRFSYKDGTLLGTGILSITSIPDQASVYLDGHLTTATNENINNLVPKSYQVRIIKEGYIPWEKKVEIQQGLVSEVKATLFRTIPSVYPLTYNGAENAVMSPDGEKLVFVVPAFEDEINPLTQRRKSGLWVWTMKNNQIAFARGGEPHQVASSNGVDYTKAELRFSPDSSQILVTLENQYLLLDSEKLNDPPRDITAIIGPTLQTWVDEEKKQKLTRLQLISDRNLQKVASDSAYLKWAPDETKFLYCSDDQNKPCNKDTVADKQKYKVVELETKKTYELPKASSYDWLAGSEHLYLVEVSEGEERLKAGKISIIEYDGSNKAEIYAGNFDPNAVFVWPDDSRLVVISSLPIPTAARPNLFGINLK